MALGALEAPLAAGGSSPGCLVRRRKESSPDRDELTEPPLLGCVSCVFFSEAQYLILKILKTTLYSGSLGSGVDEERSEMRVVM